MVNRNINVSNVCIVGCAFCGFGQGKRSPDAYEHDREEFARRVHEAVDYGASELCIQSGIHPDWTLEDYLGWLRFAKEIAPQLHLHAYSPMEIAHMCDISGLPPGEVFARLRDAGLGSTPGTAAEVLHDGVRERISPNKLPVARWVEIIEASHAAGLRSTSTVMFGHIEEPWELAEHMRVVRELQERTGGITEFVPLSFIPFQTLLGRTHGVEEISREENLKHTAVFRLALGRTIASLQASWVKMGLDAATEALRWGVNDLGGTLMEESISRLAGSYHGTKLDPDELVAAAHRAGRPAAERTTLYEIRRRYEPADRGLRRRGVAPANGREAKRSAREALNRGRHGGGVRVGRHVPAGDHLQAGVRQRARQATAIDRLDELVLLALDHDRRHVDRAEPLVDPVDHAVGGELLAGERFEVAVRHVDLEQAPAVRGVDRLRVKGLLVALIDGHGRQQLRERRVGDLPDHRQLQEFHEVRLRFLEGAEVIAGGGRVDEHQAAHLARDGARRSRARSCRRRSARRGSGARRAAAQQRIERLRAASKGT